MPFGDRSGPRGSGPETGKRAGYCSGFGIPGSNNSVSGGSLFGFGRGSRIGCNKGFGRGRGWRNCFRVTGLTGRVRGGTGCPSQGVKAYTNATGYSGGDEESMLKDQAEVLRKKIDDIQHRIGMLEKARSEATR